MRRSVPFGFDYPFSVWSYEVGSVFNWKDRRVCSIRQVFLLGSHLPVSSRVLEFIYEDVLMCLVGKTYP